MAERRKKKKILFLGANPSDKVQLRLGEEVREIDSALSIAKYRDRFSLSQKWAVRSRDVRRAILEENPQIVHFSGHGEPGYLVWEDSNGHSKCVEPIALAKLFRLSADKVQCVLLNACYSEPQAEAIAQDIDYVIGMSHEISDEAAIEFAVGFYDALGSGKTIEEAYYSGCIAIQLEGIPEHIIPVLKVNCRRLKKWILVLSTTIEGIDRSRAEAIIEHLRKLSQDTSITLKEIQLGSFRLLIESSENGFRRIQELIRTGQLTQVIGILIQEAREESPDAPKIHNTEYSKTGAGSNEEPLIMPQIHPNNMANKTKGLRPRILVLDDVQRWLKTIKLILGNEYDLTLTTEAKEALECLRSDHYDLVIIDVRLRDESGVKVLERMKVIQSNLCAVMLTGDPDIPSAVESMKKGAFDYILKKGSSDLRSDLRAKVKEALEKSGEYQIRKMIVSGEGAELEFKSSARFDAQDNKINNVVKAIAGFLNSEKGGTLLIGVHDNGGIIGLQQDYQTLGKKKNRDGYENFLTDLLLSSCGKECSPLIQITFHILEGKDICKVTVQPSPKPVFVKEGNNEHFFVRTGNSTRPFSTRETLGYCKIRWKQ